MIPKTSKKNFAIIIDSSAGYEKELLEKYNNLYVVPLNIITDLNISIEDTPENINYDKMINYFNDNIYPKTAAINIESICKHVNDLMTKYNKIYVLPLSPQYSGAYNNFLLISEMKKYKNKLFVFNTNSIFLGILSLIPNIYADLENNLKFEKIQEKISLLSKNYFHYFVPKDVSILKNSGRIDVAKELLINFLKLKIVFKFQNEPILLGKVRTLEAAKKVIYDDINKTLLEYQNSKMSVPITEEQKTKIIVKEYISNLNSTNIIFRDVYSNIIISHIGIPLICIFVERIK